MQNNWGRALLFPMAFAVAEGSAAQSLSESEAKMFSAGTGYERFMGRWSRLLAPELVAFAGVKDGERVLDVGTGTGALATALVKSGSQVTGIDPSAGFIAYAQKDIGSRARFEVGDAQALKFTDGSFDAAMALLVMNFIPDAGKAALEMRRVTRPGGIVSACVWDYDAGMQMLRYFWDEVIALDPAMEPKDERHMKLSRQGQLGDLWRKTGFVNVEEKALTIDQRYSSFHDYWESFLKGAGPGGAYVVSLPEPKRQQLEQRMRARLLKNGQDAPFTLKARAWCVKGQPPAT